MSVPNAPTPDPGEGMIANEEVSAARRLILSQLSDGSLELADLFEMDEQEEGQTSQRIVGHMHIRAALLALPHIGEVKADEVLAEVGLDGSHHIDTVGTQQQARLIEAVAAHGLRS